MWSDSAAVKSVACDRSLQKRGCYPEYGSFRKELRWPTWSNSTALIHLHTNTPGLLSALPFAEHFSRHRRCSIRKCTVRHVDCWVEAVTRCRQRTGTQNRGRRGAQIVCPPL